MTKTGPKINTTARKAWATYRPKAGINELARILDISSPAVSKWQQVPRERVAAVAAYLGVSPGDLRPDLFDPWSSLR